MLRTAHRIFYITDGSLHIPTQESIQHPFWDKGAAKNSLEETIEADDSLKNLEFLILPIEVYFSFKEITDSN